MVTGFNTDVEHQGRVYHVQTEDKGVDNPLIETLIYVSGEIMAARRSSYADLLAGGADERAIAERIEAQHNRMILDIKEGKYDDTRRRPFGEGIISGKGFEEVVLDYLRSQTAADRISLSMAEGGAFVEGETASLDLQVTRVASGEAVAGARVRVKLISTVDRPRTAHEGKTDGDGRVRCSISLPVLDEGTAALIIQATAGSETAEIKQLIRKQARKAAG
ncbi:MAG: hypothetical protein ACE5JH_03540 [Acidobacteriota bacterium]